MVIYGLMKGTKMMMLAFPLGWSSMLTIGGTSEDSAIAF